MTEALIFRVRAMLCYLTPESAWFRLVEGDVQPELAYLAIKAAIILIADDQKDAREA